MRRSLGSSSSPAVRIAQATSDVTLSLLLGSSMLACSCSGTAPDTAAAPDPAAIRDRAAAVVVPFKKHLKQALGDAIQNSGPVGAIDVCSIKAPELANAASTDGVRLGRSAVKLRNPRNIAPDWARPFLAELASSSREDGTFRTTILPDGSFGYIEAIHLQPMCETCHGKALADDVVTALAQRYPRDQATGFSAGDFRGVFWVELPASAFR